MTIRIFNAPYSDNLRDGGEMFYDKYFFTSERGGWLNSDWLVTDSPHSCFYTDIPKERRIVFISEPPEICDYSKNIYYLEQFGTMVSPFHVKGFSGKTIISNPHLVWLAGLGSDMSTLQKALAYPAPVKSKTISIVTSLKHNTVYHKKRVKFLKAAQKSLAGTLDCFGREFNPIGDKLEAIAPYKYHITIENSRLPNYWTEKLADAWACWALPIYCGDPTILEQVPDRDGIVIIDVNDIEGSLKKIHEIIDSDIYSSRLEAIRRCREWALKASSRNEFACKIIEQSQDNTPKLEKPELFRRLLSQRKVYAYECLKHISPKFADKVLEAYCRHKKEFWE